jgi:hypothetical protein
VYAGSEYSDWEFNVGDAMPIHWFRGRIALASDSSSEEYGVGLCCDHNYIISEEAEQSICL